MRLVVTSKASWYPKGPDRVCMGFPTVVHVKMGSQTGMGKASQLLAPCGPPGGLPVGTYFPFAHPLKYVGSP